MKRFALIGCAGYIAPRHMQAIKEIGGELVAALDPHDSVGILDSYFPGCKFFTEFERFDRHCEKLKADGEGIDYVSICSPNYLHDAHCRFALRIGADAICEKPLVLTTRNLESLKVLEKETGRRVWTILQLRYHPTIQNIKNHIFVNQSELRRAVIDYVTPRGYWYLYSWKGDIEKSGGLATNIGVHLFDLLFYLFGIAQKITVSKCIPRAVSGNIEFKNATAYWQLSISGDKPQRIISIDGTEIELSNDFNNLHTIIYQSILDGRGTGIDDARESIRICEEIRRQTA